MQQLLWCLLQNYLLTLLSQSQPHQYTQCFCDKHTHMHTAFVLALLLVYIMPLFLLRFFKVGLCDSWNTKYPSYKKYLYIMCGTVNYYEHWYTYILFDYFVMPTMYKWASDGLSTLRASPLWQTTMYKKRGINSDVPKQMDQQWPVFSSRVANHGVPSDVYVDLLARKTAPTERKKAREQLLHELFAHSPTMDPNFFLFLKLLFTKLFLKVICALIVRPYYF